MKRCICFTFAVLFLSFHHVHAQKAVDGKLIISEADIARETPINLNGEWTFAWGEFTHPSQPLHQFPERITVPGVWSAFSGDSPYGHGSYALSIQLPEPDAVYAIKLPDIHTAYSLFVNGELLVANGVVSDEELTSVPSSRTRVTSFVSDSSGAAHLVLHVSNFQYPITSGIWKAIEIGTVSTITTSRAKGYLTSGLLIGCLLIMGAYHLGLFISRRKDQPSGMFALMCFLLAYRELFSGENIAFELFPDFAWQPAVRSLIMVFPITMILFSWFLRSLFPLHYHANVLRFVVVVSSLFGLLVLFTTAGVYLNYLLYFNIIAGLLGIYAIYALVRAAIARAEGAWLFLFGMTAMMLGLVYDTFMQVGIISGTYIMPLTFTFLILMQSMVLAVRFTRSFFRVEELSVGLERLNRSYERFVPKEFLQLLNKDSITAVQLGEHRQAEMTVLFADIIGFTTIAENLTPNETFSLINWTLGRTSPVIRKHNGFIDKYIGDAIMAVFPDSPDDALRAALEMRKSLQQGDMGELAGKITHKVDYGIGIHTGSLILGTVGGDERMEGTVISDAVNTAARVESLTRKYGVGVIITEDVVSRLSHPEHFDLHFLEEVSLKGKSVLIKVAAFNLQTQHPRFW